MAATLRCSAQKGTQRGPSGRSKQQRSSRLRKIEKTARPQGAAPLPPLPPQTFEQQGVPPAAIGRHSTELGCQHFAHCSGCSLEVGLDAPPLLHEAQQFFASKGVQLGPLHTGALHRWRTRARLAVRQQAGQQPVIGLFERGSHQVSRSIPDCVAHHPAINQAVAAVEQCMRELGIRGYDEGSGSGELRYLQLTVVDGSGSSTAPSSTSNSGLLLGERNGSSGSSSSSSSSRGESMADNAQVQLVLVWNALPPAPQTAASLVDSGDSSSSSNIGGSRSRRSQRLHPQRRQAKPQNSSSSSAGSRLQQLASKLWQRQGGHLLHSIWANYQPQQTNTILGQDWELLHGRQEAWTMLGGAYVCFLPGSFMQANWEAMGAALSAIRQWVPAGTALADLHAGVGTIGLSLAATRQLAWLRAVEINPLAEQPFRQSAQRLVHQWQQQHQQTQQETQQQQQGGGGAGPAPQPSQPPSLEFYAAAAGSDPARWLEGAEVVVVDPPRKGLEPELVNCLTAASRSSSAPATEASATPAPASLPAQEALPASVHRLIYLSCGFSALRRDAEALLGSGRWQLRHAEAFLFFPGTDHIETLAVFDRV